MTKNASPYPHKCTQSLFVCTGESSDSRPGPLPRSQTSTWTLFQCATASSPSSQVNNTCVLTIMNRIWRSNSVDVYVLQRYVLKLAASTVSYRPVISLCTSRGDCRHCSVQSALSPTWEDSAAQRAYSNLLSIMSRDVTYAKLNVVLPFSVSWTYTKNCAPTLMASNILDMEIWPDGQNKVPFL